MAKRSSSFKNALPFGPEEERLRRAIARGANLGEVERLVAVLKANLSTVCPGCNQTITYDPEQGFTECGGRDNGCCAETSYAFDLAERGPERAAEEWEPILEEGTPPPTPELCAEIRKAHGDVLDACKKAYASTQDRVVAKLVEALEDLLASGIVTIHVTDVASFSHDDPPIIRARAAISEAKKHAAGVAGESAETRPSRSYCPYCGERSVYLGVAEWRAQSIEDPENVAELPEHQCHSCSRSFWTDSAAL